MCLRKSVDTETGSRLVAIELSRVSPTQALGKNSHPNPDYYIPYATWRWEHRICGRAARAIASLGPRAPDLGGKRSTDCRASRDNDLEMTRKSPDKPEHHPSGFDYHE